MGRVERPVAGHRGRSRGQALVEFALVAPLLFLLILGIIEAGRFIFFNELLNNATREGARYAIVHGARSSCPSGPPPPFEKNTCDPSGSNVIAAVEEAAFGLAGSGTVYVDNLTWVAHNGRGEKVTVGVEFEYDPIIEQVVDIGVLPAITIRAESSLVINT